MTLTVLLPDDIDLAAQLRGKSLLERDFTSGLLSVLNERDNLTRDLAKKLPSIFKDSFLSKQFIASHLLLLEKNNLNFSEDQLLSFISGWAEKIYLTAKFFPEKWKEGKIMRYAGPDEYAGSYKEDIGYDIIELGPDEYFPNIGYDEVEKLRHKPYSGVTKRHVVIFSSIQSLHLNQTESALEEIRSFRRNNHTLSLEEAIEAIDVRYGNVKKRDVGVVG